MYANLNGNYLLQNIDNLEKEAAIPGKLLVQAHGSYQEGTCTNPVCRKKFPSSNYDKVTHTATHLISASENALQQHYDSGQSSHHWWEGSQV